MSGPSGHRASGRPRGSETSPRPGRPHFLSSGVSLAPIAGRCGRESVSGLGQQGARRLRGREVPGTSLNGLRVYRPGIRQHTAQACTLRAPLVWLSTHTRQVDESRGYEKSQTPGKPSVPSFT